MKNNLRDRWFLVRTALTRRFIYPDVVKFATAYGIRLADAAGNLDPFDLVARASGGEPGGPGFESLSQERFDSDQPAATREWSSEPSVARCLGRMVVAMNAQTVIEVGCFVGWTTAHLAMALQQRGGDCQLHYVDSDSGCLARATRNLEQCGLTQGTMPHRGLSTDPELLARLPPVADLIFIDTTHEYRLTCAEIELYSQRLSPRGCLALHDALSAPGVRQAVWERRERFDIHTMTTERSNGLAFLFPRKGRP